MIVDDVGAGVGLMTVAFLFHGPVKPAGWRGDYQA